MSDSSNNEDQPKGLGRGRKKTPFNMYVVQSETKINKWTEELRQCVLKAKKYGSRKLREKRASLKSLSDPVKKREAQKELDEISEAKQLVNSLRKKIAALKNRVREKEDKQLSMKQDVDKDNHERERD